MPTPQYNPYTSNPNDNPAAIGPNNLVVTSSAADSQFIQHSSDLQNILNSFNTANPKAEETGVDAPDFSDPFTQALGRQQERGDLATKNLISSMQAKNQTTRNLMTSQLDNYTRGLQLLGIDTNAAQSTPDLLMGHIQQAKNDYIQKVQNLDREESIAIMEAQNAREDKNLSLLKEKMDYIKQLKRDKVDALKEAYQKMSIESDISKEQVGIYYDEMNKLDPKDKEEFLMEISKRFSIPLPTLVKAMGDEALRRQEKVKTGGVGKKLSLDKIQEYKDDYPDLANQIKYGMTEEEVAGIIEGSGDYNPIGGSADFPSLASSMRDTMKKNKTKLFEIAMELGIERKRNLSRKNEVEDLIDRIEKGEFTEQQLRDVGLIE